MRFESLIENTGKAMDALGVAAIVLEAGSALLAAVRRRVRDEPEPYERFRQQLGRSVLLGLELLVAADIIRTVALTPTPGRVAVLAGIVLVRTFLSFSLELEVTGSWPWQRRSDVRDQR